MIYSLQLGELRLEKRRIKNPALIGEWDYVVGSVGAVLSHKDVPPFVWVSLTSVRELPYVPQTA